MDAGTMYANAKALHELLQEERAKNAELRKERDFYFNQVTENGERAQRAIDALNDENAKLRELCEWLLNPYRLGAVTGEGVDKQWCRETYDGGSHRLRELRMEVDE